MTRDTTAASSGATRLWIVLAPVACLTAMLHFSNLVYLALRFDCTVPQLSCPEPTTPWVTRDTRSYREVAEDIAQRGVLRASYLRRTPGFPLLLGVGERVFGDDARILWLVPLLAAAASAAVGWLAFAFAGTTRAAAVGSFLFAVWPSTY